MHYDNPDMQEGEFTKLDSSLHSGESIPTMYLPMFNFKLVIFECSVYYVLCNTITNFWQFFEKQFHQIDNFSKDSHHTLSTEMAIIV